MKKFIPYIACYFLFGLIITPSIITAQTSQTFTSSGSFTPSAGVTQVTVECWGGGGAGGGGEEAEGSNKGGAGGAGGAYAKKVITVVPGNSYTVTVATSVVGTKENGLYGNPSWFSTTSTVYAEGGAGGAKASSGTSLGGTGSAASSIGDIKYAGGNGANGNSSASGGGGGGAGSTGVGGNASGMTAGTGKSTNGGNGGAGKNSGGNGNAGSNYGGGGGGAYVTGESSKYGGNGAQGLVIITYTCPAYSLTSSSVSSSICAGSAATVTLSNTTVSNLPVGTYTVTYNLSGANVATGSTASMTVSTAGTGTFTTSSLSNSGSTTITTTNLKSGSGIGCSIAINSSNTATTTVNAIPTISGSTPGTRCGTGTVSLGATSSAGTINWYAASTGGSSLGTGTSFTTPSISSTTTYYVDATIGGCTTASRTAITATVSASPTISGTLNVCSGSTTQLSGSGTPASSNPWVSASTGVATVNNSGLVTAVSAGTSTITYTNNNGCFATAIITVSASPSATISFPGNPYCYNSGNATITFSGTTGGTFSASPDDASINSSNGTIDLAESAPGLYTVTYTISASGGCSLYTTSTTITINPDTWKGGSNSDWNTPGNWAATYTNACPVVTVLGGIPYYPLINSGVVSIQSLVIKSGASLTVDNATFQISGSITNSGTLDISNGTLEMNGSSAQSIAGSMFANKSIKNLIVSNTGSGLSVASTANDTLKITGTLSFGNVTANLNTGDNIDLVSGPAATANVGVVNPGNIITGNVIAERYIPTGTSHGKSWQLVAAPTNGQTIYNSWMVGGLAPAGYGAWITGAGGTAAGFDAASAAPSMKTYVPATDSWVTVTNPTTTAIRNDNGYMIFIRGDRSVVNAFGANSTAIPTNLRAKGTLLTGTLPAISVPAGKYQTIGNPYASRVEFSLLTRSNIDDVFYVWDPLLYGVSGYGGYQTLSAANGYQPTSSSANYLLGVSYPYIESGQAFFVHNSTAASGSVTFTESAKASGSRMVNRPFSVLSQRQFFRTYLYNNAGAVADGNAVAFDNNFSNAVDGDDAIKMANSGENFGIKRDGKTLAVEARSPVTASDTVFYNLANFGRQTYRLQFAPQNMRGSGLSAYLVDKYLNTSTPVNLDDTSSIAITINTDAASFAANRLMVVFSPMAPLPVTFTSVKANKQDSNIMVSWKVENESNMKQYEVEKSLDGSSFTKAATIAAINGLSNNYQWIDQQPATGNNYYRIKSVDINGKTNYTQVVKVQIENTGSGISVYPNPIINNTIKLQMENQPSGIYDIRLLNPLGQEILSKKIKHNGGNNTELIKINGRLTKGIYKLKVTLPDGNKEVFRVVK